MKLLLLLSRTFPSHCCPLASATTNWFTHTAFTVRVNPKSLIWYLLGPRWNQKLFCLSFMKAVSKLLFLPRGARMEEGSSWKYERGCREQPSWKPCSWKPLLTPPKQLTNSCYTLEERTSHLSKTHFLVSSLLTSLPCFLRGMGRKESKWRKRGYNLTTWDLSQILLLPGITTTTVAAAAPNTDSSFYLWADTHWLNVI